MPRRSSSLLALGIALGVLVAPSGAFAEDVVHFERLRDEELRTGTFRITKPVSLHVVCEGAGDAAEEMYAYGWILDAGTREVVWALAPKIAKSRGRNLRFEGDVTLAAGDYVASYAAFGQWRRKQKVFRFLGKELVRFEIDTDRARKRQRDSERWELRIMARSAPDPRRVVEIIGLGDDVCQQQGFTLRERQALTVTCLGEYDQWSNVMADGGWILDAETRQRVWELGPDNFKHAGGAAKNKIARDTITLGPGSYVAAYASDGSHSSGAWNAPPPYDPERWGITIWAASAEAARRIAPFDEDDTARTILALVKQGNDAWVTQGLSVRRDTSVRVYALGESTDGEDFADEGWIEAFPSHRRVWSMTRRNTRPAGGASKNRVADETVRLAAGDYVVFYRTDDSHAAGDWNAPPPRDPGRWGITLFGVGRDFDRAGFELFDAEQREESDRTYLVRLVRLRDDAHATRRFRLDRPTRVRIRAVGEGLGTEMFDYGWIEDAASGTWVWEMTARNTRHAGGADKNRIFDGVVLLDRGDYVAHFVTDGSHAWESWNAPRPDDPTLWGLTVLVEDDASRP
jgi:hypothetical protein